jgi:hypothetical protein
MVFGGLPIQPSFANLGSPSDYGIHPIGKVPPRRLLVNKDCTCPHSPDLGKTIVQPDSRLRCRGLRFLSTDRQWPDQSCFRYRCGGLVYKSPSPTAYCHLCAGEVGTIRRSENGLPASQA